VGSIEASNAMNTPSNTMVTHDGRLALVAEARATFTTDTKVIGLAPGNQLHDETLSQSVLTTVKLAPLDDRRERPTHIVVGATPGGYQAEFMAISPDGKLVAIGNIHTTSRASNDPLFDPHASISLYKFDAETGRLTHADTERFVATNPQGLAFDASSELLYVGVGEYRGENAPLKGAIEVWRIQKGAEPSLERTDQRFRPPRGVHTLAVVN
jgi:hypothetical protein